MYIAIYHVYDMHYACTLRTMCNIIPLTIQHYILYNITHILIISLSTTLPLYNSLQARGDTNFWWWQFVWISLIAMSFYILESILCWFPFIASYVMTYNDDLLQALLNICYPLSQLFVGKRVHVSQKLVYRYILYWITLIGFKFWFSYNYIVFPVTVPSLELYDDFVNYKEVSFLKTSLLFFIWWFPHFLVYLIDLSIWYSLWSSFIGGFIALSDRQGAVRDSVNFRSHFMKSPIAFCQKLMPSSTRVSSAARTIQASTASLINIQVTAPNTNTNIHPTSNPHHPNHTTNNNNTNNTNALITKNNRIKSTADLSTLTADMLRQLSSVGQTSGLNGGSGGGSDEGREFESHQELFANALGNDVGSR